MECVSYKNCINGVPFVPAYGGNRDIEKDKIETEQMWVDVIPMDNKHATKYHSLTEFSQNEKTGGMKSNASDISRLTFIKHISGVHNFFLIDSETKARRECKSPAELFDEAPEKLVAEIMRAIVDRSHLNKGKKQA